MRFGYRTTNAHLGPPQTLMIENFLKDRAILFVICIKNLNFVIKHYKMHHFRDDNNLLDLGYSLKILKKLVNFKEVSLARQVSVWMYLYLYVRK